jgi:hypothetical protein
MEPHDSSESSAACMMEVDDEDSWPSSSSSDGVLQDCSSACPLKSTLSSSSRAQFNSAMHTAVIRELSLVGPVDTVEEMHTVLALAAKAAGGQIPDCSFKSLLSAASEWLRRSCDAEDEVYSSVLDSASFAQDSSVPGCTVALAQLRETRRSLPDWIAFRPGMIPVFNGYMQEMTADTFVRIMDPQSTHVRSILLAARLLWPDAQEEIYEHIQYSFKRSTTCCLEREEDFKAVWGRESDAEATKDFAECVLQRLLIMDQQFLRDVLPNIMVPYMDCACSAGLRVACYKLVSSVLTFWLDTVDYENSTTGYRLRFCRGDITSPNGDGIIHNMYGMKQFFEQAGNTNLMASVLAETGIKNKMRYDQQDESGTGVW